jgi:hypothetical protein
MTPQHPARLTLRTFDFNIKQAKSAAALPTSIYVLFNNAVSSSDYVQSNDRETSNSELDTTRKEVAEA